MASEFDELVAVTIRTAVDEWRIHNDPADVHGVSMPEYVRRALADAGLLAKLAETERLQQELGTIRGELADFAQESVPSHVPTLQAVRWLIAEHDGQVKHNEEVGEENRALCDERDQLAAMVERLRAGNAEYAKVFATWQSLWDEKEEWEKAAKEAWQRENVLAWLHAEARWMLRGMARRVGDWRRTSAGHYASFYEAHQERDEALAALEKQQALLATADAEPSTAVDEEEHAELVRLITEHGVTGVGDAEELAHEIYQLLRPDGPGCWAEDEGGQQ